MAKQSMIQRDKKRDRLILKYKAKRNLLRSQLKHEKDFDLKLNLYGQFQALSANSSPTRHRNRCWVTGRSRGYYRFFGLSRHVLREMAQDCHLPGVKKSSW
jgi:small subunit ribosomal protein S14